MNFFIRWWVNVIALLGVVLFIPGIHVDKFQTALLAALVLGLVNAFLRPMLIAFTMPLTILSLGLFTLVINGFLFFLVSRIVPGFTVDSFWSAVWGALVFGIFSFMINLLIAPSANVKVRMAPSGNPTGYRGRSCGRSRDNVIDVEAKVESGSRRGKPIDYS